MGSIEIFRLRLFDWRGGLTLTCLRDLAAEYVLESETFQSSMSLSDASSLGFAGKHLQILGEIAARRKTEMKSGCVFCRQLPAVRLEIGVPEGGDAVYLEANDARFELSTEEEIGQLKFVLRRLRDDVNAVYLASASPIQTNLSPR